MAILKPHLAVATLGQQRTHTPGNSVALTLVLHLLQTLVYTTTQTFRVTFTFVCVWWSIQSHSATISRAKYPSRLSLWCFSRVSMGDLEQKAWVRGKVQGVMLISVLSWNCQSILGSRDTLTRGVQYACVNPSNFLGWSEYFGITVQPISFLENFYAIRRCHWTFLKNWEIVFLWENIETRCSGIDY